MLADDFQLILDGMPVDWTDLEVDLQIEDESKYVDTAVALSRQLAISPAKRPKMKLSPLDKQTLNASSSTTGGVWPSPTIHM